MSIVFRRLILTITTVGILGAPLASAAQAEDLAAVYAKSVAAVEAGDFKSGAQYSQQAFEIAVAQKGPDHPETGILAFNTGILYIKTGQYEVAEKHLDRALEIYGKVHGVDSPKLLPIMDQLQVVYNQTLEAVPAAKMLQQRLAIEQKAYGKKSIEAADTMRNYAIALAFAHNARRARRVLREAMKIYQEIEGENSLGVGETYFAMAAVEFADNTTGTSKLKLIPKYSEKGEAILRANLPVGHPRLVRLYTEALRFAKQGHIRKEIEKAQAKLDEQLAAAREPETAIPTSQ